jgi:hypothetical protein
MTGRHGDGSHCRGPSCQPDPHSFAGMDPSHVYSLPWPVSGSDTEWLSR